MPNIPDFALPQTEKSFVTTNPTPTNTTVVATNNTWTWVVWIFVGILALLFIIFIIWAIYRSTAAPAAPVAPVPTPVPVPVGGMPMGPPRDVIVEDDCGRVRVGTLYPAANRVRVPGSIEMTPMQGSVMAPMPGMTVPTQETIRVGACQ